MEISDFLGNGLYREAFDALVKETPQQVGLVYPTSCFVEDPNADRLLLLAALCRVLTGHVCTTERIPKTPTDLAIWKHHFREMVTDLCHGIPEAALKYAFPRATVVTTERWAPDTDPEDGFVEIRSRASVNGVVFEFTVLDGDGIEVRLEVSDPVMGTIYESESSETRRILGHLGRLYADLLMEGVLAWDAFKSSNTGLN